jgi:hypothetical protein
MDADRRTSAAKDGNNNIRKNRFSFFKAVNAAIYI